MDTVNGNISGEGRSLYFLLTKIMDEYKIDRFEENLGGSNFGCDFAGGKC